MTRVTDRPDKRRGPLVWRRKWLILLTAVVVGGVALGVSLVQAKQYTAAAEILVGTTAPSSLFPTAGTPAADPVRTLQTEIQLVQSEAVKDAVRRKLQTADAPSVVVESVGQSDVMRISAHDSEAETAAATANAYAQSYIDVRKTTDASAIAAGQDALQKEIGELGQQIDGINAQITATPADQQAVLVAQLQASRDAIVDQRSALTTRLLQLRVDAAMAGGEVRIVVPATTPDARAAPSALVSMVIALAVGAALGCGLALAAEYRDKARLVQEAPPHAPPSARRQNATAPGHFGSPVAVAGRRSTRWARTDDNVS